MDANDRLLNSSDLLALVETARELAAEVNLKELLQRILDRATGLTDSPDSSIILSDEGRNCLYIAHATGSKAGFILEKWGKTSGKGIPIVGSKAGQVFTTGRSIIEDALLEDPTHFKGVDRDTGQATESMICVPLSVLGRRIGVVQLLNKRGGNYTPRDLVLLEHFADQAAVAIRNARLFEDLLAHMGFYASTTDGEGPLELLDTLTRPAYDERLSVLFADMRGFTQLCNMLRRPERTQAILNEYLGMLADAVLRRGGLVNKFLGDGLMALFRAEGHEIRALECAFDMVAEFQQLRDAWNNSENLNLDFLDVGIGIASDWVILGSIGSPRVRDFTAVGAAVNFAALLMEHARDNRQVLVDKLTFKAAEDMITEFQGPEIFKFKKPGQEVGHPYERYHVVRLARDGSHNVKDVDAVLPETKRPAEHTVFVSYSHKDLEWLNRLQTHLRPYVRSGAVAVWDDTKIASGALWLDEIRYVLSAVRVAVLLVSPNFLDSEFVTSHELLPLLRAASDKGVRILWVPVSASSYDETELGRYQAAMDPARPLDTLTPPEQNQALVAVCKTVKSALASWSSR